MKTQNLLCGKEGMCTPLAELRCGAVNSGGWSYPRLKYITKGKCIKIYNVILLNGRNADLDWFKIVKDDFISVPPVSSHNTPHTDPDLQ